MNKIKRLVVALLLTFFSLTYSVFLQDNKNGFNSLGINYQNYNVEEIIRQNEKYAENKNNGLISSFHDLLDGYTGKGYNLEEQYQSSLLTHSLDSNKKCDDYCISHGPGRVIGGTALLDNGCRNYKGWLYGNYGSLSIPFWINMNSMNTIASIADRNELINDIRYQVSLWNSIQMHDGSGTLIYLYEVGIGESSRPDKINGKRVVEILRKDGDYAGEFSFLDLQIRINYDDSLVSRGRNPDTPLHEMGHLLGLNDLDDDKSGISSGTHKTLMGYNRGTTRDTIDDAIKYQDIQGVAVLNNIHTVHQYSRYIIKNDKYLNICFYCDRIDSTNSVKNGSLLIQNKDNCVHDYQQLVSCAKRHWLKCTKCYKVVETEFDIRCESQNGSCVLKILGPLNSNVTSIVIPSKIGGQNVTSIGSEAFKGCASLSSVIIPNTITNIDSSAFEGCLSLQTVSLSNNLTSIGNSVFKGCASLSSITIPNSVQYIDSSAFEGCSYLQSVSLSNHLVAIGSSAFKGCASLSSIIIPNSVTHIDSSAFEGCSYLQSVTLSNYLYAIGTSAFKGCSSLGNIVLPSSVEYIDNEGFKNCSSLASVTVNRTITSITNLGENVFDGCDNDLQIIVPINRIAEYKNKEYWSSYRNKIGTLDECPELEIDCESSLSDTISLNEAHNQLYKLNVNCSKSYKINTTSSNQVNIIVYDSNMNVIENSSHTSIVFLSCGIYYISFEYEDINASGIVEIGITLTWTSTNILVSSGVNHIQNSMHLNKENEYHCSYKYLNHQGEGFYKFSLDAGAHATYPIGTMKIYTNQNRTTLLNKYGTTGINQQATTNLGENELYVYLPENGCYYLEIVLPHATNTLVTLTIEEVEKNDIDYQDRLASIGFDELFYNQRSMSYFEEVRISHRSTIELDIVTNGMIQDNIPVYIFEKQCDPGYEAGDEHYYIVEKLKADITNIDKSPIFSIILNPGIYYIGYVDNIEHISIQCGLRRIVNQDVNINGTLVTDPARNQGYPLGSEVTLNHGALGGNTITEGFTRNIYLMVEDRVHDPMSRLEYDWYSSNENVAKVTAYGTVLALHVTKDTNVRIYAINKKNPTIVYQKEFTILKETKTEEIVIESNMSYSYTKENGLYTLELDFTNSPYPYIGYYVWDIESLDEIGVDMEHHHLITSTGLGEVLFTGHYTLNTRIVLKIHLTITE